MTPVILGSKTVFKHGLQSVRFLLSVITLSAGLAVLLPAETVQAAPSKAAASVKMASKTVDINHADAETIASTLTGIGLKKAQAIVTYRKKMGAFESIEQLTAVKGIGPKMLEKNKGRIALR